MPGKCWKRLGNIIINFIPIIPAIPGQVLYQLLWLLLKNPVAFFFLDFFPRHPCPTPSDQPEVAKGRAWGLLKAWPLPTPSHPWGSRSQHLQSCVVVAHVVGDEVALPNDCCIKLGLGSGFISFPRLSGLGKGWGKKTHKEESD